MLAFATPAGTVRRPKKELVESAVRQIHSVFPASRKSKLVHSVVIKERRATFSPTNSADALRPPAKTPIDNLFLAGDWTQTGLPATIEGAVLSGFRAAELCMEL